MLQLRVVRTPLGTDMCSLSIAINALDELFDAHPQPDASWTAGSGARFPRTSGALRPAGWTSADAARLPILPALMRYDEVNAGSILHALRFHRVGYLNFVTANGLPTYSLQRPEHRHQVHRQRRLH